MVMSRIRTGGASAVAVDPADPMGDPVTDAADRLGDSGGNAQSDLAVSVRGLHHAFRGSAGSTRVIDGVEFDIETGTFVSIIGPSGCGKTTVLNIMSGLERAQTGRFDVFGDKPAAGRSDVSVAFARDALLPWRRAIDNVALPLELRGVPKTERNDRALAMLELVGLGAFKDSYRGELSQGMRQRVALARALVSRPRLLLLDEPFAALDAQTRVVVQGELIELLDAQEFPVTTVMVTHDLSEAIALSDVIIEMSPRPATVKATYRIDLQRPRDALSLRTDPNFHEIYDTIWRSLSNEFRPSA